MDSNEQALNTFLGSRNAFVAMSVKGDGGSYLSWIKSQYKQEVSVPIDHSPGVTVAILTVVAIVPM